MTRRWGLRERQSLGVHMAHADDRPLSRSSDEPTAWELAKALTGWLVIVGLIVLFIEVFT